VKQAILCASLFLVMAWSTAGQNNTSSADTTASVSCWNEVFKDYHTRFARSKDYVAPDSHLRAYATVRAKAVAANSEEQQCENESALFVANGKAARAVLTQSASDTAGQGNGIQIIDWSADSKQLLADAMTWHYFSEDLKHHAIVYNVSSGSLQRLDLDKLFSEYAKQDCEIDGRIRGFASDGSVVLEVWPIDEVYGESSCVKRRSIWQLKPSSHQLTQLPSKFKLKRNAVVEHSPTR
jgi:hypothetical protein